MGELIQSLNTTLTTYGELTEVDFISIKVLIHQHESSDAFTANHISKLDTRYAELF